jgi:hypothetical protein
LRPLGATQLTNRPHPLTPRTPHFLLIKPYVYARDYAVPYSYYFLSTDSCVRLVHDVGGTSRHQFTSPAHIYRPRHGKAGEPSQILGRAGPADLTNSPDCHRNREDALARLSSLNYSCTHNLIYISHVCNRTARQPVLAPPRRRRRWPLDRRRHVA